jgi:deazaflavin-dependent oxidoreductase (nitroreductase family)
MPDTSDSTANANAPARSEAAGPTGGPLDPAVWRALGHGHTIDITTTGRRSGEPRRLEIVFHNFGGRIYISGLPNPQRERAWLLNLRADPNLTVHLKQFVQADLRATAREITDPAERREVLEKVARVWRREAEPMVRWSPLIEVVVDGYGVADSVHPVTEGA